MLSGRLIYQNLILYIVLFLCSLAIWYLFCRSSISRDIREPVSIRPKIPIIGHAISLLRHGSDYYEQIRYVPSYDETCSEGTQCLHGRSRARTSLPIYTLELFGHKIYVVNSAELVLGVDRSSKDFSFAPYLVQFAARALHPTEDAIKKLSDNLDGGNIDPGLRIQTRKAMRESLAAGTSALNTTTRELLQQISTFIDVEATSIDGPIELFHWVRSMVTTVSTNAVYGLANPFLRKKVADGLW